MRVLPENRCPRCGGMFRCGVDDDAPCPCTRVPLDAALQQRLRERYAGCLCPSCLAALAQATEVTNRQAVPDGAAHLLVGRHAVD